MYRKKNITLWIRMYRVTIDDKYDEEKIIKQLGEPDGKGRYQGIRYMNYFIDEYVLIFYEDYFNEPFSAGIGPKEFFQGP